MHRHLVLTLAAMFACMFFAAQPVAADDVRRPNVLFIAVDDLNDWISSLGGNRQAKTPNLDRLAQRGVVFTNAHCAAPACNPSRAALMTGIPPYQSGVYHNNQPWRKALPDAVTLPQHLMQHGYTALGSGKIYHGGFPDPPSWNDYFPSPRKQSPGDPSPQGRPLNGIPRTAHFDWGPVEVEDEAMGDAKVAAWVGEQLGRPHDKPFFLACGLYRPHLPWYVPKKYYDMFPLDSIELPKVLSSDLADVPEAGRRIADPQGDHRRVIEHDQWRAAVRGYLASIAFSDAMLGRVLDALDAGPHANNTIIVLWSDHGWHLGEKEHWRKFTLWEEATRVVLMAVAPKGTASLPTGTPAGARCDAPVSLMDLYPTLVELCGLEPKPGIAGQSLVPLLRDPSTKRDRPAITTHGRGNHAVRDERWRFIRYADGSEELYDHEADPMEWTNLAGEAQHAEVKQRLAKWLPTENAAEAGR